MRAESKGKTETKLLLMRGQGQGGKVGNRVGEGEAGAGTTGGEVRKFLEEGADMGSGEEPGRIAGHVS